MAQHADSLEMLQRFAAGDSSPEVLQPLQDAFSGYLLAGGEVPLERCLHLPNTPTRLRLAQRDAWLQRAAQLIERGSPRGTAEALAEELDVFVTRGPWRQWREQQEPPPDASRLRVALFHVARLNGGESLSARQVWRVTGHRLGKTCPGEGPRLSVVNRNA